MALDVEENMLEEVIATFAKKWSADEDSVDDICLEYIGNILRECSEENEDSPSVPEATEVVCSFLLIEPSPQVEVAVFEVVEKAKQIKAAVNNTGSKQPSKQPSLSAIGDVQNAEKECQDARQRKESTSTAVSESSVEGADPRVKPLTEMFPDTPVPILRRYLNDCGGDTERAVTAVLEDSATGQLTTRIADWKIESDKKGSGKTRRLTDSSDKESHFTDETLKKAIVDRYLIFSEALPDGEKPEKKKGPCLDERKLLKPVEGSTADNKVRYHNNNVVTRRGEKYFVEKDEEEEKRQNQSNVSGIRIITKGKRGKGFR